MKSYSKNLGSLPNVFNVIFSPINDKLHAKTHTFLSNDSLNRISNSRAFGAKTITLSPSDDRNKELESMLYVKKKKTMS